MMIYINLYRLATWKNLLIKSRSLPNTTGNQSAQLPVTRINPAQELLLYLPRRLAALDVSLQCGLLKVRWSTIIDEIQHRIKLTLAAANPLHLVSNRLKLGEVFF